MRCAQRLFRSLYQHGMTHMQRSLCLELVNRLQRHSAAFVRATAFAAELDCLVALACGARDLSLCRPVLTSDDVLHIKAGAPPRHLLRIDVSHVHQPQRAALCCLLAVLLPASEDSG